MDYKAVNRIKTREWAVNLLGGSCVICGTTDNLQFDHINPSTKKFDISVAIRDGYSRERIQTELAKCQLLCEADHRAKTITNCELTGGGWNKIENPSHGTAVRYGARFRCRCDICLNWKRRYRNGLVDSLGQENPLPNV